MLLDICKEMTLVKKSGVYCRMVISALVTQSPLVNFCVLVSTIKD